MNLKFVLSILIIVVGFKAYTQCNNTFCQGFPQASLLPSTACATCDLTLLDGFFMQSWNTPNSAVYPQSFCGTLETSIWFAFLAPQETVELEIIPSNCLPLVNNGLQAQIFASNDCQNSFTAVSNCLSTGFPNPGIVTATNLEEGAIYYLLVDGFNGDECDMQINVLNPPGGIGGIPNLSAPEILGSQSVCLSSSLPSVFTINNPSSGGSYNWDIQPASSGTIISNPIEFEIAVQWNNPGLVQVCTEVSNTCSISPKTCLTIDIIPSNVTTKEYLICEGETVICGGQVFTDPGIFPVTLQSSQGCDSVVNCIIDVIPSPVTTIQLDLCAPDTVESCGQIFTHSGIFTTVCQASNGCDSIVILNLAIMDPVPDLRVQHPLLTCFPGATSFIDGNQSTFNVASGGTTSFQWTGSGITTDPFEVIIGVDSIGEYCLELTHERNGVVCNNVACIEVEGVDAPPDTPPIFGPTMLNWGDLGYLETSYVPYATEYNWESTFADLQVVNGGQGVFIDLTNSPGASICLTVENGCGISGETCHIVESASPTFFADIEGAGQVCGTVNEAYSFVTEDTTIISIEWHVLNGTVHEGQNEKDVVIEWDNGDLIGTLCVSVNSMDYGLYQRCDLVSVFDASNTNVIAYDTASCYGDCVFLNTEILCETGYYEFGYTGNGTCDQIFEINYYALESEPIIEPPLNLDCNKPTVILDATNSNATPIAGSTIVFYKWTDQFGNIIPDDGQTIEVDEPGLYCLEIIHETNWGMYCSGMTCVDVIENVLPPDPPTASLSGSGGICEGTGETIHLEITCTGNGPWELVLQIDGIPQPPIIITQTPYIIEVDESNTGLYDLLQVTDVCNIQGTVLGQSLVEFYTEPIVTNVVQTSDLSNLGCIITFDIDHPNPIVLPPNSGTLTGNNPYTFTSNLVQHGNGYEYLVYGNTACDPITISQNIVICDCETEVGVMDLNPIYECGDGPVTGIYDDAFQLLDANDVVSFFLHEGNGAFLSNPIATNTAPVFGFDPALGMLSGVTYYISAVVGNDDGTGTVDIADPCLAVSQGTPIEFYDIPTATIFGDSEICDGGCVIFNIELTGVAPWSITIDDSVLGINTISGITNSPYEYMVCPQLATIYNLVSVEDANCPGLTNGTGSVSIRDLPTAEFGGGGTICEGSDIYDGEIHLTGEAPWEVCYTLGGNPQVPLFIQQSPYTLSLTGDEWLNVQLTKVVDGFGCSNTSNSSTPFDFADMPVVSNIDVTCNPTATAYVVSFDISGGDPSTYIVSPANSGTLSSFPQYTFTSYEIPSGDGYSFVVTDGNACDIITVSEPSIICQCITSSGTMDAQIIEECGLGPVLAVYDSTNQFWDADDITVFILHEGNGPNIINLLATNTQEPTFSFDPSTMNYGQTYYISAVTGNADGTGLVDLNDPCLSVAQGTPVVFNDAPFAQFVEDEIEICEGDFGILEIELTGSGPWDILLDSGNGPITYGGVTTNPLEVQVAPANTEVFVLIGIGNLNCSVPIGATATVNVLPNNLKFQSISADTTLCKGDSTQLMTSVTSAIQYDWSPSNTLSCSDCPNPIATPLQSTNYKVTATDATGCTVENNIQVFVQCFEEYDTVAIGQVGIRGLNLPPWQATQADICFDEEENTSIGFYPNGFFYVGLSEGMDTICVPLNHPNPLMDDDVYTLYVTVIKKPIFNFNQNSSDQMWGIEGNDLENPSNWSPQHNDIIIYPNPASDILHILSENEDLKSIELYDLSGRMVLRETASSTHSTLIINNLKPGSYFVKIETKNDIIFKKVILL